MLAALLLTSLTLPGPSAPIIADAPSAAAPTAAAVQEIKVWLNKRGTVRRGDRVKVYVRSSVDGYLLLLHAEPDGRVRVLFPLDPGDDNYIRGGRDLQIRGRGDREAITIYETSGYGVVYAAFSRDPFRFNGFVFGDHWDYQLGDTWRVSDEVDADLTSLAQLMAGDASFQYDLVRYDVGEQVAYDVNSYGPGYSRVSVGLHFGFGYPGFHFGFGYPSGFHIGFGYPYYGYAGYYNPFFPYWYDPFYWPYYYGRTFYGYHPYYPWYYHRPYYYRPYYGGHYYRPYYRGSYGYSSTRFAYSRTGTLILPRYTIKSDQPNLGRRYVGVRRRAAPSNGFTGNRRVVTKGRATPQERPVTPTRRRTVERRAPEHHDLGTVRRRTVDRPTDRAADTRRRTRSNDQRRSTTINRDRRSTSGKGTPSGGQARSTRRTSSNRDVHPAERSGTRRAVPQRPSSSTRRKVTPQRREGSKPTVRPSDRRTRSVGSVNRGSRPSVRRAPSRAPTVRRAPSVRRPAVRTPSRARPSARARPKPSRRRP